MTPYSAEIPLRRSTVWGAFEAAQAIPHRFGATAGTCLQYSADRKSWVWSDGVVRKIITVTVNDQVRGDWQWRTQIDSAGQPVALIEFTEPIEAGSAPVATGLGRINPVSGALIDQPADLVLELLRICGNPVEASRLDSLRADTLGIVCAGTLDGSTLQAVMRSIAYSIGAVTSPVHPALMQIYPGGSYVGRVHTLDGSDPDVQITATARREDLVTYLVIEFDRVDGDPRQTVDLYESAARTVRRKTITLDWISDRRSAIAIGERLLRSWSKGRWSYSASNLPGSVRPGDVLDITSRRVADADGAAATVLRLSMDPVAQRSNVSGADAWLS